MTRRWSGYRRSWTALPAAQRWMLLGLAAALVLANIRQPYPAIAPLQHIPTVALIIAAPPLLWRFPLSDRSVAALLAFFLLHTLAGRYTYSNVPYDAWARAVLGHDVSSLLGLTRNDFDRVVHFSFGLLWVGPVAEVARRHGGLSRRAGICIGFLFVGAASAAYETFEWLLTVVLAPGMADDYNGQQGDVWDSQKDMATAIVGALVTSTWLLWRMPRSGRGVNPRTAAPAFPASA
ncbi:DUF2238 domain-containing protein [Sphingomonas bacterium]|uniref:DUF2238 domain-containing protein n=1 Tax=Sphingomonas bacterium TaxID=1895847 RepID=UPI0020C608A2|nr:DUF2238 domain-containing protein [Sphingomonas bacterium]